MRIISGRFGRRKLLTNPGIVTRPITDRVKESLFQFLEDELDEARVADVFAGTGTIGLEALSRGASSVVFIEQDRKATELLRQNVHKLGVEEEVLCWQTDVLKTSFRPKNCDHRLPYDLVFFDPPYPMVPKIKPGKKLYKSLERLGRDGITRTGTLLLIRTPKEAEFACPPVWQLEDSCDYSTMKIHWFRRAELPSADETLDPEQSEVLPSSPAEGEGGPELDEGERSRP